MNATTPVGVIGGGQLARMMLEPARRLGIDLHILDPDPDCPTGRGAASLIVAPFDDGNAIERLAERTELITFDIERGHLPTLDRLVERGFPVRPGPRAMRIIRDKFEQRRFLEQAGLPVPRYTDVTGPVEPAARAFGFPLVQKARRGGYDGRGVAVLEAERDLEQALDGSTYFEERIDIVRELAVVVVRALDGETRSYAVIEVLVDPRRAILDGLLFPARIDEALARRAARLAEDAVGALDGVGSFTVELFEGPERSLWVNEISPRPHNSGHVTLEAAVTSQFEQHLRAITGLPLGSTAARCSAAMVNLLGSGRSSGPATLQGIEEALRNPEAHLHLYGKVETWPGRKMGHLTVTGADAEQALEAAEEARSRIRIAADEREVVA